MIGGRVAAPAPAFAGSPAIDTVPSHGGVTWINARGDAQRDAVRTYGSGCVPDSPPSLTSPSKPFTHGTCTVQ